MVLLGRGPLLGTECAQSHALCHHATDVCHKRLTSLSFLWFRLYYLGGGGKGHSSAREHVLGMPKVLSSSPEPPSERF